MILRSMTKRGFTILELMSVVVIIGVLATVAIPMVTKYMKRSKTSEASLNLRKIYDGEVAYFAEEITDASGTIATKKFVTAPVTPAFPPNVQKRVGNWEQPAWAAIKFTTESPVLYCYSTEASGAGPTSAFTARAQGDVDGDSVFSTLERVGAVNATGEILGGGAVFEINPGE